mmetsp:Transcript_68424/g.147661  ORF Transcript_68424/g.147661 Transcript_68424/m.147661 type:complete len:97 (+) Transcript_68424:356-646(+)
MLQRIFREFHYIPKIRDILSRHKEAQALDNLIFVGSQYVMGGNLTLDPKKPFNPVWGETYRALIDDIDFSFEKTLHKPPVLNFYGCNADKSIEVKG